MSQILMMHIIIGSVLLVVSFMMKLWPPKKINNFYGYRTPRSMKNQLAWDEANFYGAGLLMWGGVSTLIIQALGYIFIGGAASILIAVGYYALFILVSIVLTEKRLKTKGY